MITRLYCSFRRNSHTPCLHPVIHFELPFPSLHCFLIGGTVETSHGQAPAGLSEAPHHQVCTALLCACGYHAVFWHTVGPCGSTDGPERMHDHLVLTDFYPLTFHLTSVLLYRTAQGTAQSVYTTPPPIHLQSSRNFV